MEENFDVLTSILLKLFGLVYIKFQHFIDLCDSYHDTEGEGGEWNYFISNSSSHDKDEVEVIINPDEVEDFVEALEHQNAFKEDQDGSIIVCGDNSDEESQKENYKLG